MKLNYFFVCSLLAALMAGCEGNNQGGNESNNAQNELQSIDTTNYLAVGKKIASGTQAALAKNLLEAIANGGTENAIEFCNINAIALTDSMAVVLQANVKRVTDRPRNAINSGNETELALMQHLKNKMENGETPNDTLIETGENLTGYYPIITNAMCLQCHGNTETDINAATYKKLQQLYPEDKATGYAANELRGLWKVTMAKKNTL